MARFAAKNVHLKDGRSVVLRHCGPDDAEKFIDYQKQIAVETTNTMQRVDSLPPVEKVRENWRVTEDAEKSLKLGVFDGDRLIGQLAFWPINETHPWAKHIGYFGMGVLKEYWGQGIGKMLLQEMEGFALSCGLTRIEAMVRTQNERGLRLYTGAGYSVEGVRQSAALIEGQYQDEYYLGKLLSHSKTKASLQLPDLETERLLLRPLVETDAEAIYEYAKNPNVSKYTLWEPHKTLSDSMQFIVEYAHKNYQLKQMPEPFGICFKDNPEKVIGTVGCFWVSKASKSMELAYAIDEKYWGQGIVVEASRRVIDHCFESYDVFRMQCRCKVENHGSRRVMEKLGMQFEGTLKSAIYHREQFWDMHWFSVLKHQWK